MKIKLCGFSEENSLKAAIACDCDFLGFVFFEKSPRFIDVKKAKNLVKIIPSRIAKVAVVVDATKNFISEIITEISPDFIQFHGNETAEFLREIKKDFPQIGIIKAFRISAREDLAMVKLFENCADFFLFDSKISTEFGGSGKKFDWNILKDFSCKKDWFLSGGINLDNIDEACLNSGAKMIDISSGIEKEKGKKSPELIAKIMQKVKKYDS